MKILIVAAEVVPFAKVGGLADVTGALPKALKRMGHDVRVAMPKYQRIQDEKFGLKTVIPGFDVPLNSHTEPGAVKCGWIAQDIPVYLIDSDRYFNREGIYGYPDDDERFIFFSRAALEMLPHLGWWPDVVHCNDWHTAIIPNWLKTIYRDDPRFSGIASLFTIHNLAYQGIFGHRVLEVAGLESYGFVYPDHHRETHVVDLLGRGLLFADAMNTVSEQYAEEIKTPDFGECMDGVLRDRQDRLFGILNGLDYEDLNPRTDRHIAANYDRDCIERRIENKLALQREANLEVSVDTPLIGMVSRLADQKGFDILASVLDPLLKQRLQLVVLGTGDQHYHDLLSAMAKQCPNLAIFLTFNTTLAQKIYAGTDLFLMPSHFEPCGLGQLMAMRYGSVPIVRKTGGLADTVQDYNPSTGEGRGFVFERYNAMDLFATVMRAVESFKYRDSWRKLVTRDMDLDFSWSVSAARYVDVYQRAIAFHKSPELVAAG